ncbi:hypothetical protein ACROYT_G028326 [Oculina patagonica]
MLFVIFAAGLSTGAVSGIVIAIFVVIILACLAVYVLCFKTQGSLKVQRSGKHSRNEPDSTQYAITCDAA